MPHALSGSPTVRPVADLLRRGPRQPDLTSSPNSAAEPVVGWKGRLLILAMGMSAVVLLVDRNSRAMAQNRPLSRVTPELAQRPPLAEPQQVIWVNSQTGSDSRADGSEQAPFRTITRALETAQANTTIQLAPGTYSTDSGELFPLALKAGVTLQGNPDKLGQDTIIRGGGDYSSSTMGRQNVTLVGASQSVLTGVTITNPTLRGHGLWVETGSPTVRGNTFTSSTNAGLYAAGSSSPLIQNNLFLLNRVNGIVVTGSAQPRLLENLFQRTGSAIAVNENAAPQIVGNRISQNRDGIVVQGDSQPILRHNTIEDSERDGIVVIAQAQPNLGTVQEPGQNSFFNNQQHDIDALATTQTLPAYGNQLTDSRIAGRIDLSGQAPLIGVTTVASAAAHLPSPSRRIASLPLPATPQPATLQALPAQVLPAQTVPAQALPAQTLPAQALPAQTSSAQTRSPANLAQTAFTTSQPTQRSLPVRTLPVRQPALIGNLPPATQSWQMQGTASSSSGASSPGAGVQRTAAPAASVASGRDARIDRLLAELRQTRQIMARGSSPTLQAALSNSRPSSGPISIPVPQPETGQSAAAKAIPIPVPAPETSGMIASANIAPANPTSTAASPDPGLGTVVVRAVASLPRQNFSGAAAPLLGGSRISVPAPAAPAVVATATPTATRTSEAAAPRNANLLLVPPDTIPLGNTGDLPRVSLASLGGSQSRAGNIGAALQYRVVVPAADEQAQALVQSIMPQAFAVSQNGQALMQVGAFSSYDNAQGALALLSQNGLQGMIQPIE